MYVAVATPLWGKCEDETHTPESGNLESSGTPTTSELDCRGQKTSPWGVLYTVGKGSKCRCRKWPRMGHSDICSTSYGQKKGWESNYQTDSLTSDHKKLRIDPTPGCEEGVQHTVEKILRRATSLLQTSFQFEVWAENCDLSKSRESKPGQSRDFSLGVPGIKAIWMRVRWSNTENNIWGKVVVSLEFGPWWVQWVNVARDLSQHQRCFQRWINPFVVGFWM
jgi:hypothetical protein